MSDTDINPMGSFYASIIKILDNLTIKYTSKAEEFETTEIRQKADEYLDVINGVDNFFTYIDYTEEDFNTVGLYNYEIRKLALSGKTEAIPERFREPLLSLKRQRILDEFEEKNNYYRCLNGFPDVEDQHYFYVTEKIAKEYDIDINIPIHLIQDYYNKKQDGLGDFYVSALDGIGFMNDVIELNPDKEYLKYIGVNRIDLNTSRKAKNFQVLQLKSCIIKQNIIDHFLMVYEQCREYFVKTVYIREYRSFIDYYDNFIAMSIMIMTIQQMVMKQISLGIKRDFFDIFAVKALYEAYDIPCNLNIDDETQSTIVQNINLMIQNKATNKVIYDIASLLGFSNINVYKYYLSKQRKFDIYGVPVVKTTQKFNSDTGELETVPDYEAMYELYFQKCELKEQDFIHSFMDSSNKASYKEVTTDDPFWIEDDNLYNKIWQSQFNFVESKYLSIGISYSMTDIMFENVLLIKLLLQKGGEMEDVQIILPRILGNISIPIFDVIVLLVCLTSCFHNLYGEIITIPTQVIDVLDYMQNIEETDMLVDTFAFDFDYFSPKNEESAKQIENMKNILGEDDYKKFLSYISVLSFENSATASQKIETINAMYENIKGLSKFLNYQMTQTDDRETYTCLKTMYNAVFYSKELRECFTITGEYTGIERTAWTYFEFLYYRNRKLYNAIFDFDLERSYNEYISDKGDELDDDFDLDTYTYLVEEGSIKPRYDILRLNNDDEDTKNEKIYYYMNHIIASLGTIINDVNYMYLLNGTNTPLEELLIKLVRFFKSYTVDMISLDSLFIFDVRAENMFRLFDEIFHIRKVIAPNDWLHMPYDDAVHLFQTYIIEMSKMDIHDKLYHEAYLILDNMWGVYNSVRLQDNVSKVDKQISSDTILNFSDLVHTTISEQVLKDNTLHLRDSVTLKWDDTD